jgi:histidine ammonia-lyase
VITLDGERLTLSDIVAVADGAPIRLGPAARDRAARLVSPSDPNTAPMG